MGRFTIRFWANRLFPIYLEQRNRLRIVGDMKSITQFRVCFLAHANVAGRVVLKEFSTQWFDSKELAASSKWMGEIGAHLVSRIYAV